MVFISSRQKENMDIAIILSIAIMWSFTAVHCGSPCAPNKIVNIRGLYEQNVDLVCKTSGNCTRVFWKRRRDVGMAALIPDKCDKCAYKVSNNAVNGTNILHIQNLSRNVEGVYTCYCKYVITNSTLSSRSTEACYNLTIDTLECGMKVSIKGQRTLTYDGNHLDQSVETLDANINDVLSVACLNDEQKQTNCSELEHPMYDIPLRSSDTGCHFSCKITEGTATCEVNIILNVTAGLLPPSTNLTDAHLTSTISTLYSTPNFSTDDYQDSPEFSNELYATEIMTTLLESEQILSTTNSYSEDEQSTYETFKSTSQHLTTDTLILTTPEDLSTVENQFNTTLDHSIFQDKILFSFVIALSFTSTIIILQSVFITILTRKLCVVVSSEKEKWVNPIYDSSVNNHTTAYAVTEILGETMYSMTPQQERSLPCLDVVGIQERRKFHSLGSLNITENKDHSSFTEKDIHGKAGNGQGDGVVSYLNANLPNKLDNPVNLNENLSDIESDDSFSSFEEEDSHLNNRFSIRKERITSLHIYEDASIGRMT